MYVMAIIYLFCYLYLLLAIVESRADRDRDLLARVEQENEQLKAELAKHVGRRTVVSVGEQDTSSDGGEHELTRNTWTHRFGAAMKWQRFLFAFSFIGEYRRAARSQRVRAGNQRVHPHASATAAMLACPGSWTSESRATTSYTRGSHSPVLACMHQLKNKHAVLSNMHKITNKFSS